MEVFLVLLKHDAKLESADKDGRTPLYSSVSNGHLDIFWQLLQHGANVDSETNDGGTPLKTAAKKKQKFFRELQKHASSV